MNGLDASLLSSMAFRNPLQGKVKMSIHRILNDKDEVKKNGKNTDFCWDFEKEGESKFLCSSGKTPGKR